MNNPLRLLGVSKLRYPADAKIVAKSVQLVVNFSW